MLICYKQEIEIRIVLFNFNHSSRDIIAIVTELVNQAERERLRYFGWTVIAVDTLPEAWWRNSKYNDRCMSSKNNQDIRNKNRVILCKSWEN